MQLSATVGSTNLDNRSFATNEELNGHRLQSRDGTRLFELVVAPIRDLL
jgi:phosphatidylserine/phosphatidylglycerophosphate/cardiolipin synthase-like enzyme